MSAYPVNRRQGKITIVAGVAAIISGFVLQGVNAQSFASEAPPQFASNTGSVTLVAEIAGLLILCGVITTVIGVIRYAQSGRDDSPMFAPAPAGRVMAAAPAGHPGVAATSAPVSAPAFCSSCGARIAGEGRFCASCGTSTAR
ncbi:MAG: hypothetical protein ACTHNU_05555 [Gaiellales bacterium]